MTKVIQNDESMIPEGVIAIRLHGTGADRPWHDVGNNSAGTLNVTTESRNLPNYRGGGGNRNSNTKISEVTAAFTMFDLSPENIARALRGTQTEVNVAPIVDELLSASGIIGEVLAFKYLPDRTETITVKTAADAALVEGTDYTLTPHGISVQSALVTAAGLKASYTPAAGDVVDLLVGSDQTWEVRILGTNAAQDDKPFKYNIWKAKFNIAGSLALIADTYAELPAVLNVLVDDTVDESGLAKFAKYSSVR